MFPERQRENGEKQNSIERDTRLENPPLVIVAVETVLVPEGRSFVLTFRIDKLRSPYRRAMKTGIWRSKC